MPLQGWKTELGRLCLLLVVAAFLGLIFGFMLWFLLGAALAYAFWSIKQLRLLNRWLYKERGQEPPEAAGLWGQVFDNLSQMQRENERVSARLRANIEHLRSSFASMADAVVMLTPDGSIEWSNKSAQTLLGLRQPDDNGRLLVNLLRSPEFMRYFESGDFSERLSMASPVNAQIQLSISVSVFGQENRLLFARDISRTVQLEQMRKDFVANVSHELRTPLTVITGYLEMLADQDGNSAPVARALDQMSEQSRRMQNLIEDLMKLSRLEALPSSRLADSIAIKPLMESIRDEVHLAAVGERNVVIECDESLRLRGDYAEILSAFSNLASNAARYTKAGDTITLRWYADRNHAYFEVQDNGIGIEPQHLPRLTERFYRVDKSRSTETGGTGLGLAIVKHVLLRHHAELRIHSYPGRGSTFSCEFPLSAVEQSAD